MPNPLSVSSILVLIEPECVDEGSLGSAVCTPRDNVDPIEGVGSGSIVCDIVDGGADEDVNGDEGESDDSVVEVSSIVEPVVVVEPI